ncbi:hypothetical protein [Pectobacterium brasiliense]|uniref:hypothetical protein n=1 Tax=Pectobacterium brasiliense TaxID=180957 RepID=UPI0019698C02|nr:hypothetical protein [Pectobacterium brasiliense]MBN3124364.1 hypothetical protein [Pectobacterium brasiliense]
MIPLQLMPEPQNFDLNVRQKGALFLNKVPNPNYKDFVGKDYWRKAAKELYSSYRSICAYSCIYLPTSPGVVDHFLPKTKYPQLAYEWSNYRLCLDRLNQYKGNIENICDPFTIEIGWFVLDLPSCLIKPGEDLPQELHDKILYTIDVLKLNKDDGLVQNRCDIIMYLIEGDINMNFVEEKYPFIAQEIKRQGLVNNLSDIFKRID